MYTQGSESAVGKCTRLQQRNLHRAGSPARQPVCGKKETKNASRLSSWDISDIIHTLSTWRMIFCLMADAVIVMSIIKNPQSDCAANGLVGKVSILKAKECRPRSSFKMCLRNRNQSWILIFLLSFQYKHGWFSVLPPSNRKLKQLKSNTKTFIREIWGSHCDATQAGISDDCQARQSSMIITPDR